MSISLLPEWFEECLSTHPHPENGYSINGITISGTDSCLPSLECLTKNFKLMNWAYF